MKPEFKLEGDKATVKVEIAQGIDKDGDGVFSASLKGSLVLELDASEIFEEALKDSKWAAWIKEKLGV